MRKMIILLPMILLSLFAYSETNSDQWAWEEPLSLNPWLVAISKGDSTLYFLTNDPQGLCAPMQANYAMSVTEASRTNDRDLSDLSTRLAKSLGCRSEEASSKEIQLLLKHVLTADKKSCLSNFEESLSLLATSYSCTPDALRKIYSKEAFVTTLSLSIPHTSLLLFSNEDSYKLFLLKRTTSTVEISEWSKAARQWQKYDEKYVRALCSPTSVEQIVVNDLLRLADCAIAYNSSTRSYPEGDDWARVLRDHCKIEIPKDPWGKEYSFIVPPGSGIAILFCSGSKTTFTMEHFEKTYVPMSPESYQYSIVLRDGKAYWLSKEQKLVPASGNSK